MEASSKESRSLSPGIGGFWERQCLQGQPGTSGQSITFQNVEQHGDVWQCQNSERKYQAGQGEYMPARLVDKGFS